MSDIPIKKNAEEIPVTQPRVSVLMPAYNVEDFIDESIQSVIAQTYTDWELVVVNDCSTDKTAERVERFDDPRIRLIHTPQNLKLCRALNFGLEHCRGDYVARLDSDDNSLPKRLARQVEVLDANPGWALLGTGSRTIDETGNVVRRGRDCFYPTFPEVIQFASAIRNNFRHSSVMFRRSIVNDLGGYPVEWHEIEDYGLWAKMLINGCQLANIPDVLCEYRVRAGSMMTTATAAAKKTKEDPRRNTAKLIYTKCALNIGLPETVASAWGEAWVKVKFPITGNSINVTETLSLLNRIVATQPNCSKYVKELQVIRRVAFMELVKASFRQRDFGGSLKVIIAAANKNGCRQLIVDLVKNQIASFKSWQPKQQ